MAGFNIELLGNGEKRSCRTGLFLSVLVSAMSRNQNDEQGEWKQREFVNVLSVLSNVLACDVVDTCAYHMA